MLLIVFGSPGAGKNYICEVLKKDFSFHFYDIDNDITTAQKRAIAQGIILSDETRTRFFNKVVQKVKKIRAKNNRLAIAQAFIKEKHRKLFLSNFPEAKFIYVKAKQEIINSRLGSRNHLITKNYADRINKIFEKPIIPHYVINNDNNGEKDIKIQIRKLLNDIQ